MTTNFASLGISVESSDAVKAAGDLDKLVVAAEEAEEAVVDLGKASDGLANIRSCTCDAEGHRQVRRRNSG